MSIGPFRCCGTPEQKIISDYIPCQFWGAVRAITHNVVTVTVKIDAAPIFGRQISQNIEGFYNLVCHGKCSQMNVPAKMQYMYRGVETE